MTTRRRRLVVNVLTGAIFLVVFAGAAAFVTAGHGFTLGGVAIAFVVACFATAIVSALYE